MSTRGRGMGSTEWICRRTEYRVVVKSRGALAGATSRRNLQNPRARAAGTGGGLPRDSTQTERPGLGTRGDGK